MQTQKLNSELTNFVKHLIDTGSDYRLDELAGLYSPDLIILMIQEDGSVLSFDYDENLDYFKNLRDSGSPPLDKSAEFSYAEIRDEIGYVVVTRKMNLGEGPKKIVFNVLVRKNKDDRWQAFREHAVVVGDA